MSTKREKKKKCRQSLLGVSYWSQAHLDGVYHHMDNYLYLGYCLGNGLPNKSSFSPDDGYLCSGLSTPDLDFLDGLEFGFSLNGPSISFYSTSGFIKFLDDPGFIFFFSFFLLLRLNSHDVSQVES